MLRVRFPGVPNGYLVTPSPAAPGCCATRRSGRPPTRSSTRCGRAGGITRSPAACTAPWCSWPARVTGSAGSRVTALHPAPAREYRAELGEIAGHVVDGLAGTAGPVDLMSSWHCRSRPCRSAACWPSMTTRRSGSGGWPVRAVWSSSSSPRPPSTGSSPPSGEELVRRLAAVVAGQRSRRPGQPAGQVVRKPGRSRRAGATRRGGAAVRGRIRLTREHGRAGHQAAARAPAAGAPGRGSGRRRAQRSGRDPAVRAAGAARGAGPRSSPPNWAAPRSGRAA